MLNLLAHSLVDRRGGWTWHHTVKRHFLRISQRIPLHTHAHLKPQRHISLCSTPQIVKLEMALLHYFQAKASLPTAGKKGTRWYCDTAVKCSHSTRGASKTAEKAQSSHSIYCWTESHLWKIHFRAWKCSCSEEVQGRLRRWSARRKHSSFVQ